VSLDWGLEVFAPSCIFKKQFCDSTYLSLLGVDVVVVVVVVDVVVDVVVIKASWGQQILGTLKPPILSKPHMNELLMRVGKLFGNGLFKFEISCKNGEHLLYNSQEDSPPDRTFVHSFWSGMFGAFSNGGSMASLGQHNCVLSPGIWNYKIIAIIAQLNHKE